ncbi:MAG: hypothetical protein ACPL4K_04085, partial [Candidatus Margulisiibacteriota bacterium]
EDVLYVRANLAAFGLSAESNLRNDGLEGDMLAKDDVWTLRFAMAATIPAGNYQVPIEVANLAGGVTKGTANLTVYK